MRIKKLALTALTLFFSFSLYAAETIKIGASMPLRLLLQAQPERDYRSDGPDEIPRGPCL